MYPQSRIVDLSIKEDKPISVRPEPVEGPIGFDRLSPNGAMNDGILNSSPPTKEAQASLVAARREA